MRGATCELTNFRLLLPRAGYRSPAEGCKRKLDCQRSVSRVGWPPWLTLIMAQFTGEVTKETKEILETNLSPLIARHYEIKKTVRVWIPGLAPVPKGNRPRIIRRGRWTKLLPAKRAVEAERALTLALRPHAPRAPLSCPVRRDCVFFLPIPKSWPAWKREAARARTWLPTGGGRQADTGNLVKLLDDALEGAGILLNDGQIVGGECAKLYGAEVGYLIQVTPLVQGGRGYEGEPVVWWLDMDTPLRPTTI